MRQFTKGLSVRSKRKKKESKDKDGQSCPVDAVLEKWEDPQRPRNSAEPQNADFILEDEGLFRATESLLRVSAVADAFQSGNPFVFASQGLLDLAGYSKEETLGRRWDFMQGPKTDSRTIEQISSAMNLRRPAFHEVTFYAKNGREWSSLACHVPVVDHYGNVMKYFIAYLDIEDRANGLEAQSDERHVVRRQEQIHQLLSAFMITDTNIPDAPITSTSPGFTTLTGFEPHEVMRISNLCLCGPNTQKGAMRKIISAHHKSRVSESSILWYKKDGSPVWMYILSYPLASADAIRSRPCQHLNVLVDVTSTRPRRIGKYITGRVIGSGASGVVRIGKSTISDEIVAVKIVDAGKFRSISEIEQIQDEISVLSNLKHPHIIRLLDVHFIDNVFYFIMEFASGGALVRHIYTQPERRLDEEEARRIFRQMVSAVDYCHRRRVIHRDLKPENILMDDADNVKVADFGLAAISAPFSGGLNTMCGTPEFLAPEVISGREYDGPAVDVWSMGVILYEFVSGKVPFSGSPQSALFKEIQRGIFNPLPSHISEECGQLVSRMLKVDPASRITMEDILKHPWVEYAQFNTEEDEQQGTPEPSDTPPVNDEASGVLKYQDPSSTNADPERMEIEPSEENDIEMKEGESGGMHDSVKLVLSDWEGKADPVSMAIMRSQMGRSSSFAAIQVKPPTGGSILTQDPVDDFQIGRKLSFEEDSPPSPSVSSDFQGKRYGSRKRQTNGGLPPLVTDRKISFALGSPSIEAKQRDSKEGKLKMSCSSDVDSTREKQGKPAVLPPIQERNSRRP